MTQLICTYAALGYPLSHSVGIFVNSIICEHGPYKRHFEVAWALWLALSLKLKLSSTAVGVLQDLQNSICTLMALDLQEQDLIPRSLNLSSWLGTIDKESPYREHWLLVYEGAVHKWLGKEATAVVAADLFFNALASEGVRFYNTGAFNRPLNLPHIEWQLDIAARTSKSQLLPGQVYVPKKKGRIGRKYLESLGDDYGQFDFDTSDGGFQLDSDDEIQF